MEMEKKINGWTMLFGVLSILSLCFIFYNSMQSPTESELRSLAIVGQVKPILDVNGRLTEKAFNKIIRCMAHLAEFGMLGFSFGGMFASAHKWTSGKLVKRVVILSLLAAIADETLQYFTGRYSDVKDVMLDVIGAFIGVIIIKIGMHFIRK